MPRESSCCLYGCALCSLSLRGTQPCRSPDERVSFSPSPAVLTERRQGVSSDSPFSSSPGLVDCLLINLICYRETGKDGRLAFPCKAGRCDRCCKAHTQIRTQNTNRSKRVQRRSSHGAYHSFCTCDALRCNLSHTKRFMHTHTYRQPACPTELDKLYCKLWVHGDNTARIILQFLYFFFSTYSLILSSSLPPQASTGDERWFAGSPTYNHHSSSSVQPLSPFYSLFLSVMYSAGLCLPN